MVRGKGLGVVAATCLVAIAVGCGGGGSTTSDTFGPDPDFGTLDARLSTPTGTMSAPTVGLAAALLDAIRSPQVGIDALTRVTPSNTSCDALGHRDAAGTCACPAGGSFAYDFSALADHSSGSAPKVVRMRLSRCHTADLVLDGEEFAELTDGAASIVTAQLAVSRVAATAPSSEVPPSSDVVVWSTGAGLWARVAVSDGAIVVGSADSASPSPSASAPTSPLGTVTVKDRSTTWTCSVTGPEPLCAGVRNEGLAHKA